MQALLKTARLAAPSLVAVMLHSAPALAAFGAPIPISGASTSLSQPQVSIDAQGDALIVWTSSGRYISSRFRLASGVLGPVRTLSGKGVMHSSRVAFDGADNAVVTWIGNTFSREKVQGRSVSSAGALSPIQTFSPESGQNLQIYEHDLAVADDGDAVVTWVDGSNRNFARDRSASGALGAIQGVSAPGDAAENPRVRLRDDGEALFLWRSDSRNRILSRIRTSTGLLGAIQDTSPPKSIAPRVTMGDDGSALVTWKISPSQDLRKSSFQSRELFPGGTAGSVQQVSLASNDSAFFSLGLDSHAAIRPDGSAMVVWALDQGHGPVIYSRSRSADGVYATRKIVGPGRAPKVAFFSNGDAVIVWKGAESGQFIQARTLSAAGQFGPIQTISEMGNPEFPAVAVGPDDKAVVVWADNPNEGGRVQAAVGP